MSIAVATLFAALLAAAYAKGNANANGLVQTNFGNSGLNGGFAQGSGHVTFNNNKGQPQNNNNFNHISNLINTNNQHMGHSTLLSAAAKKGFTSSEMSDFLSAKSKLNSKHVISNAVAGISSSRVSVKPTTQWFGTTYISPYNFVEVYSHHVAHVYVTETCPPPSSSIEVCLSTIFDSMEYYLKIVESSLVKHEVSIHNYMHHEHSLLTTEVSWVKSVKRIGYGVKKAVHIDESALSIEIKELIEQKQVINNLYTDLYYQLNQIVADVSVNIQQINYIKQEYNYIKTAKWQLYGYISAIIYEKGAVNIAIDEVNKVVSSLRIQVQKIYTKITQLTKRQTWLVNWENRLYIDLQAFSKDVVKFRNIQTSLYKRQVALYSEQTRLKKEALYAKAAIEKLKEEYHSVREYINYLNVYEKEIYSMYVSIYGDAKYFISAYEMFTCEDSLLYYEACSSTAAKPTPKPAKPTAKPAPKPPKPAPKPVLKASKPAAKP